MVTRHKAFRYRVYLTSAQIAVLNEWDIALRCLWNLANEQWVTGLGRVHAWKELADQFLVKRKRHETSVQLAPTVFSQQSELTQLRAAYPQLAAVPRNVCNQLLVELDKAWQRCFEQAQGRSLIVAERGEQKLDLVQDFIDVVTSMCARIYGRRAAGNRAKRALAATKAVP